MDHTEPLPKPTHWAVLIGVGITIDNQAGTDGLTLTRDSSLEGAVADINMMESYFKDDVRVKINKLTATKSPDKTQSNPPLEPLERLPTTANVISALKEVIRKGADGHIKHVYIHFSGHGTRAHDGTLALSLYEPHPRGRSRLLTQHIATALNKMTEQGMHVTLVLDCCFSGSVKRTEDGPGPKSRFIKYEPEEEHLDLQNPFLEGDSGQVRQTSLNMGQLLEPDGYNVITACGPSENAWEVGVGNGKQHGLLSYFLHASLMHLKRSGENISFQTLYRHLQAKFHANYPRQTPRHYGSMTTCFFQHITCDLGRYLVTAFRIPGEERLILKAGKVHGVHEGDTYEAYPYYASEADVELLRQDSVLLQVQTVESLQSDVLPVKSGHLERFKQVSTWKAEPVASQSHRKTQMHISTSLSLKEQEILQESLSEHPFLQFVDQERDQSLPTFNISLDENEYYELRDGNSHLIPSTPVLLRSEADSLISLSTILGHLATFKFFEGIENYKPNKHFEESIRIHTSCKLESDGWIKVRDQETFDFSITNLSKRSLYLSVFNLRSSWQICNMIAEAQAGTFHEIEAEDDEMTFPITMEIPEQMKENGGGCNEDIFKIFVTDQPPYFPFQVLPKLGNGETRDHSGTHELVRCLESLEKGYWGTRQTGPGHWMTRNFLIRTYV